MTKELVHMAPKKNGPNMKKLERSDLHKDYRAILNDM